MAAPVEHHNLLDRLAGDPGSWTGTQRVDVLSSIEDLRGWVDAREAAVLAIAHGERDDVDAGARDIAGLVCQQTRVGCGEARRRQTRALWLPQLPVTAAALDAGRLRSAHVDLICELATRLRADKLPALAAAEASLVDDIASMTPVEARKRLLAFETELDDDDDDGQDRLDRQRANNALRLPQRPDGTTGITGQLDPIAGNELRAAIDTKVTEIWRRQTGNDPDLPAPKHVLTNEHRRADALLELIRTSGDGDGDGSVGIRAQLLVHIDYQTLLGQLSDEPIARLGDGTPIPAAEARKLACDADIVPIVLGGPTQPLDVGRARRLATAAQRHALAAIHPTCAIEGCDTPFTYCTVHHIDWWTDGGTTDLDNLIPLCHHHHHLTHQPRWHLTITPDRTATLTPAKASRLHPGQPPPSPTKRTRRSTAPAARGPAGDSHPRRPASLGPTGGAPHARSTRPARPHDRSQSDPPHHVPTSTPAAVEPEPATTGAIQRDNRSQRSRTLDRPGRPTARPPPTERRQP